jgi:hypothetical protein
MATIVEHTGSANAPFNSVAEAIAAVGGIEEEFLFEGTATLFQLEGGSTDYALDGRWNAEPLEQAPFRSRMLVVRPGDPATFNGTVLVSWNNVSASRDGFTDPARAVQLLRDGFALVGVSAQAAGINGPTPIELPDDYDGIRPQAVLGLRDTDPERYGTLDHPGDGYSYDIFTQAGALLAPDRPRDVDPLGGLEVRHLVANGGSQSANRLATYVNAVQPKAQVFDGFMLLIYAGCPTALDPATAPASLPEVPSNTVELLPWRTYLLRDDLDAKVLVLNSEFEAEQCSPNTQPDSDTIRTWEIAGTAHLSAGAGAELLAMMPNANQVSFGPANRAAFHALRSWIDDDVTPPHQPRLDWAGEPPRLVRDDQGNATGGIRWPDLEAPLGTHVGESEHGGFANLMGSTTWFAPDEVRALYTDRATWLARYSAAVDALVSSGVILADDAEQVKADATGRDLGI